MAEPHEQKSDLTRQLRHGRRRQGTALFAFCLFVSLLMPFRFVYCSGPDGHAGIRVASFGRCCCCTSSVPKNDPCRAEYPTSREAPLAMQEEENPCGPSCVDVELPLAAGMKALDNARHPPHLKAPCDPPSVLYTGQHFSCEIHVAMHPPPVPAIPKTTERLSTTILLI